MTDHDPRPPTPCPNCDALLSERAAHLATKELIWVADAQLVLGDVTLARETLCAALADPEEPHK